VAPFPACHEERQRRQAAHDRPGQGAGEAGGTSSGRFRTPHDSRHVLRHTGYVRQDLGRAGQRAERRNETCHRFVGGVATNRGGENVTLMTYVAR